MSNMKMKLSSYRKVYYDYECQDLSIDYMDIIDKFYGILLNIPDNFDEDKFFEKLLKDNLDISSKFLKDYNLCEITIYQTDLDIKFYVVGMYEIDIKMPFVAVLSENRFFEVLEK